MTQEQLNLIVGALEILCLLVCFLKWKFGTVVFVIIGSVAMAVVPLITGNYITNLLWPLVTFWPIFGAIRLAKPVSWWAKWFYWGPMDSNRQLLRPSPKLARAFARFPEQAADFAKPEPN